MKSWNTLESPITITKKTPMGKSPWLHSPLKIHEDEVILQSQETKMKPSL